MSSLLTAEQLKEKIAANVVVSQAGCWLWQKSKDKNGYGNIAIGGGKNRSVHRVSCEIHHGLPDGKLDAMHSCDIKHCCNPAHLSWGTRSQNTTDAVVRLGAMAKLSVPDVRIIKFSGRSTTELMKEFPVSRDLINRIKRGALWSHVKE